jgi:hypothetical protein
MTSTNTARALATVLAPKAAPSVRKSIVGMPGTSPVEYGEITRKVAKVVLTGGTVANDAAPKKAAAPKKEKVTSRQQVETLIAIADRGGAISGEEAELLDMRSLKALKKDGQIVEFGAGWQLTDKGQEKVAAEQASKTEVTTITAEDFRVRCETAFGGWGWQGRFAKGLGVSRQTIAKWVAGTLEVPEYAVAMLETLECLRRAGVAYPPRFMK